jgi:glycosyltransferase involved in cell wall biosynthesis
MHNSTTEKPILADGRWSGLHGIGRFSDEVLPRLQHTDILTTGPHPLSIKNFFWQAKWLKQQNYRLFFTPGFTPPFFSSIPFVMTIHDLIHLHIPGNAKFLKKIFYTFGIKPAAKKAHKILTPSHYSKQSILEWLKIPADRIEVVGNGISTHFTSTGEKYATHFPYFLYVGNSKAHKNLPRLITAFGQANIDPVFHLICTGQITKEIALLIKQQRLEKRVLFLNHTLTEEDLAAYYRGAMGLLFPSLYEGFGLPVLEAMASGIPVLTSQVTSLPEVAGDAALYVNPYEIDSIAFGIERLVNDTVLRNDLIAKGFNRARLFSWDKTAHSVQSALAEVL